MRFLTTVLLLMVLLSLATSEVFHLPIIHFNDFHARFEQTNNESGICKDDETCIGGLSRNYYVIKELLNEKPDSLLLNAGDNFQGTMWYNVFKWNVTQYFLNKLPWDAIVLGNHEFDDGIKGVVPFIKNLNAPVIVSNIDDSLEPDIQGIYQKSVVVERNGKKIGIIGVIVKTTDQMSKTENLKFYDESASVNAEAERLVNEEGVFTNIVLSHSGYDVDKLIAQNASNKIGVIVGGHSHSFLYTGDNPPGPDIPVGDYPTIVENRDGKKVVIVQASAYCKYLGNITIEYNKFGDVTNYFGRPIFMDTDLPQDKDINDELQPWQEIVDEQAYKIIGSTLVTLDKSNCYYSECILGNFVTDVMVYNYLETNDENSWAYASIAIFNAGGLRTNIDRGNITYGDMMTAQPFENTFDVGEIQGKYIKEAFEMTTERYFYGRVYSDLNMLQVSGLHVVLNLSQPQGSRVQSIKVRCNECDIPIYEDLDMDKVYRVILPSFIVSGGDGFSALSDNFHNVTVGEKDIDVYVKYLAAKSPVFEEIEGRIEIIGGENVKCINMN